jgi:integrase
LNLDLFSEDVNGNLPIHTPAYKARGKHVKANFSGSNSGSSLASHDVSLLFLQDDAGVIPDFGGGLPKSSPKLLAQPVFDRFRKKAERRAKCTIEADKVIIRKLLGHLVSNQTKPTCGKILQCLRLDKRPADCDIVGLIKGMSDNGQLQKRIRTVLRTLFGAPTLAKELNPQVEEDAHRNPASIVLPNAAQTAEQSVVQSLRVDLRDLPKHRMAHDIAIIASVVSERPDADPSEVAFSTAADLNEKLRAFCASEMAPFMTRSLAIGALPSVLTLMMLEGINQAAALTMVARTVKSHAGVMLQGCKARAGYKGIKIVVGTSILQSYFEMCGLVDSAQPIFPKRLHKRVVVLQRQLLTRFSCQFGLTGNLALRPSQLRPSAAQRWVAEGVNLSDVQERLHHETAAQTFGYVDGLAYRLKVDKLAVAALAELDKRIMAHDPAVCELLKRQAAGQFAFDPVRNVDTLRSLSANLECVLPNPQVCIDRRSVHQAMPLASSKLILELICRTVRQVCIAGSTIAHRIARGLNSVGSADECLIARFHIAVDTLLMASGLRRSDLKLAKTAEFEEVNGAYRLKLAESSWKPVSRLAVYALEWWKTVKTALTNSIRPSHAYHNAFAYLEKRKNWVAEGRLRTALKHLGMPLKWDRATSLRGEKWVFSGARLEKMLVSLWPLLGNRSDETLYYLCGDHKFRRAPTTQQGLLRTVAASTFQSDLLAAVHARAASVEAAIAQTGAMAIMPGNGQEHVRLPSAVDRVDYSRELAVRIQVLGDVLNSGVCPVGLKICSVKSVIEWHDAAYGAGQIGKTNKLVSGNRDHGGSIATIQGLVRAIKAKVGRGELRLTSPAFANDNAPTVSANACPDRKNDGAILDNRSRDLQIADLFAKTGPALRGSGKPYQARLTQIRQFDAFCQSKGVELLPSIGNNAVRAPDVSFIPAWHAQLCVRNFKKRNTLVKKLRYLRDALLAMLDAGLVQFDFNCPASESRATELSEKIKEVVRDLTRPVSPAYQHKSASDAGFARAHQMAAKTLSPVRNGLMIKLTLTLGLRASELAQFPVLPAAANDGSVSVELPQKGGSIRTVYIHASLANELREYARTERSGIIAKSKNGDSASLFLSGVGKQLSSQAVSAAISRCLSLAGQIAVRPHAARGLAFSEFTNFLVEKVGAWKAGPKIALLCGHANVRTTKGHYCDSRTKARLQPRIVAVNDNCSLAGSDQQAA